MIAARASQMTEIRGLAGGAGGSAAGDPVARGDRTVPSGLALAAGPDVVERAADPASFIVAACERAKAWLAEALEHGQIDQIAEARSQAEAVRVYTLQKQLGADAQLAATEIVRRAERGIGVAIRRGQAAGQITRRAGHGRNQHSRAETADNSFSASRPGDYASASELTGNHAGIYHLTDQVDDHDFETALAAARAEGNLSRANIVRKIRQARSREPQDPKPPGPDSRRLTAAERAALIAEHARRGMTSRQIAATLGINDQRVRQIARDQQITIPADVVAGRARRLDPNRIVRETAHALEGLAMSAGLVDFAALDPAQATEHAASLARSLRVLGKLSRQVREVTSSDR